MGEGQYLCYWSVRNVYTSNPRRQMYLDQMIWKSAGLVCIFLSHLCIDKVKSFLKRNLNMLTNLRAWGCRYLYIDYRRGNLGFKKHHYAHMWSPAFLSTNLGNAISNALFLGGLRLKWPSGTELKLNEGNHFLRFKGFLWGSLVLSLSLLYG